MEVWAINPHESVCPGDTVSFEVEITDPLDDFILQWDEPSHQSLDDSEHYSLNENKTVLTIHDALPPHAGYYHVVAYDADGFSVEDSDQFYLDVPGITSVSMIYFCQMNAQFRLVLTALEVSQKKCSKNEELK